MEMIDWAGLRTDGMPAFTRALSVLERNQQELEVDLQVLRSGLPLVQRLETVWFRRYAELMRVLWRAGMPGELEGEQIVTWLRGRLGTAAGSGIDGGVMFDLAGDGRACKLPSGG